MATMVFNLNGFVGNIHIAEDLAIDTFVVLGTKRPRDKGNCSFKTWLYTIGRNRAINYLKKHSKVKEISLNECSELISEGESLEIGFIKDERKILLHKALGKLKPEYHQVLWLFYFEDLSQQEIGYIMKKSRHSVETLIYRARKSLKAQLEKEDFVYEEL